MTAAFYRRMFFVGALWNVLGGFLIVLSARWIFELFGLQLPIPRLYFYSWIALFMTFGLGYYIVSLNPDEHSDIIALGAIGKLAFSVIFIWDYFSLPRGDIPRIFWLPVVGDLVFASLFILFLVGRKKRSASGTG
jgi:hypothetical protein